MNYKNDVETFSISFLFCEHSYITESLDRAMSLYILTLKVKLNGIRAVITVMRIKIFVEWSRNIVRFRFLFRMAERSMFKV